MVSLKKITFHSTSDDSRPSAKAHAWARLGPGSSEWSDLNFDCDAENAFTMLKMHQYNLLFIMFSHCHDMKQRVENKLLFVHIKMYSRFQLWEKQRVVQRWVSSYHRRGQGFNLVCDCSQSTSHVNGLSGIQQISTCRIYYGSLYLQNTHTLARHWEFT